jgi:hypothetical protein
MSEDPFKDLIPVGGNITRFGPVQKKIGRKSQDLRRMMVFAGDIEAATDVAYLVKGWLAPRSLAVLYGPANVGKTFLALDLANAISRSDPWGGCKVRGAQVLYVTLEGGAGFDRRVSALKSPNFWVLSAPISFMRPEQHATWLAEAVQELAEQTGSFGLIVIDTLARAMAPGDENSSQDMGRLVASAELLKERTGACVLLIHHTGKSVAQGARGHSSLRAAIDTEIEVSKEEDGDVIEAKATKQRDMMVGKSFLYHLREVELGRDSDGDAITTCVVERAAYGEKPVRAKVTGRAALALQALHTALERDGVTRQGPDYPDRRGVTGDQWKAACHLHGVYENVQSESERKTFSQAKDALLKKDLVRCFGDVWWLV